MNRIYVMPRRVHSGMSIKPSLFSDSDGMGPWVLDTNSNPTALLSHCMEVDEATGERICKALRKTKAPVPILLHVDSGQYEAYASWATVYRAEDTRVRSWPNISRPCAVVFFYLSPGDYDRKAYLGIYTEPLWN